MVKLLLLITLASMTSMVMSRRLTRGVHCGSGWSQNIVRDRLPATGLVCPRKPDFAPSCKIHDDCYDTCGTTQQQCDKEFLDNLKNGCKTQGFTGACLWYCTLGANIYYKAVAGLGDEAFEDAQRVQKCSNPRVVIDKEWIKQNGNSFPIMGK